MRNVFTSQSFIFNSTVSGVYVYDIITTSGLGFVSHNDVNSIWCNEQYLYIGSTVSGILRTPLSSISGSIFNNLTIYKQEPNITSNTVNYIHGKANYICITTNSGVDQINTSTDARIYTTVLGATKCYQTSSGRFYYTTASGLNVMYNNGSNWSTPDYMYTTTGSILDGATINDIDVQEGKSVYNPADNLIYLATTIGIKVIEERQGDESNSRYMFYLKE